jgi:hypothetical protein
MSKYDAAPIFHVKWSGGERTFTDAAQMGRFIAQGVTIFRISFSVTLANPDTAWFEPLPEDLNVLMSAFFDADAVPPTLT